MDSEAGELDGISSNRSAAGQVRDEGQPAGEHNHDYACVGCGCWIVACVGRRRKGYEHRVNGASQQRCRYVDKHLGIADKRQAIQQLQPECFPGDCGERRCWHADNHSDFQPQRLQLSYVGAVRDREVRYLVGRGQRSL